MFYKIEIIECIQISLSYLIIYKIYHISFNFVQFSKDINSWKSQLTTANDNACISACDWISKLNAIGNTNILDALEVRTLFHEKALFILSLACSPSKIFNIILFYFYSTLSKWIELMQYISSAME